MAFTTSLIVLIGVDEGIAGRVLLITGCRWIRSHDNNDVMLFMMPMLSRECLMTVTAILAASVSLSSDV